MSNRSVAAARVVWISAVELQECGSAAELLDLLGDEFARAPTQTFMVVLDFRGQRQGSRIVSELNVVAPALAERIRRCAVLTDDAAVLIHWTIALRLTDPVLVLDASTDARWRTDVDHWLMSWVAD